MDPRPDMHQLARDTAATLVDPDRKHLRLNEIVECAIRFYKPDYAAGVIELVKACDKAKPDLYVRKSPMWRVLNDQYRWMQP